MFFLASLSRIVMCDDSKQEKTWGLDLLCSALRSSLAEKSFCLHLCQELLRAVTRNKKKSGVLGFLGSALRTSLTEKSLFACISVKNCYVR